MLTMFSWSHVSMSSQSQSHPKMSFGTIWRLCAVSGAAYCFYNALFDTKKSLAGTVKMTVRMNISEQERQKFKSCNDMIQNDENANNICRLDQCMSEFWVSTYHSHQATHWDNEKASRKVLNAWIEFSRSHGYHVTADDRGYGSTSEPNKGLASKFTKEQRSECLQNLRKASASFANREVQEVEVEQLKKTKPNPIKPWMWGIGGILTGGAAYACYKAK